MFEIYNDIWINLYLQKAIFFILIEFNGKKKKRTCTRVNGRPGVGAWVRLAPQQPFTHQQLFFLPLKDVDGSYLTTAAANSRLLLKAIIAEIACRKRNGCQRTKLAVQPAWFPWTLGSCTGGGRRGRRRRRESLLQFPPGSHR